MGRADREMIRINFERLREMKAQRITDVEAIWLDYKDTYHGAWGRYGSELILTFEIIVEKGRGCDGLPKVTERWVQPDGSVWRQNVHDHSPDEES